MNEFEASLIEALYHQPNDAFIKESLRDLYSDMIDRWHFLMLNDIQRNSCFNAAISKAVHSMDDPQGIVLDIGSGTGLLSLMAVINGAEHVTSCEVSDAMVDINQRILDHYQLNHKIKIIHKSSTSLKGLDNGRASLVVTEIFDAGLLGELVIPTLRHAWAHLLSPAGGRIIPSRATVYINAIECQWIRLQSKLINCKVLDVMDGIVIRGSCKFNNERTSLTEEPYTCERLSLVKGSFKYLSAHRVALKFNFNDPQVTLPSSEVVTLPIDEDGRIDALMMWFELHLDDEISFNTLPSSNNSWEQALYPSHDVTINVTKGTNILVNTSCTDAAISLNISTDNSIPPPPSSVIHYVESSELASLNDVTYIDTICQSLDELLQCDASWYVLDITSLPLISLLSSKHIEYIMIANVRSYYRPLVDHIISHNQLNHKTSIASIQSISAMTWDIVLYDPITPQGTLDTPSILLLNQISNDTISLCESVQIHITGISSPALRARSCVLGTIPTLGLEIAPFINKYQVTHYADIDLSTFPYKAITEVLTLDISPLNQELSIESSVPVTVTDSLTGLAYWFTLRYYGNHTISTGPNGYPESHWHQSVFMSSQDQDMIKGDKLKIKLIITHGAIDIITQI